MTQNSCILIGLDTNQSEKSSRRRTEAMNSFMHAFLLKKVLTSNDPTFHHNNQTSSSQIDNILFCIPENSVIKVSFLKLLCKLNNFANLSSHDALVAKLDLPLVESSVVESDYSSTYQSFIVSKPIWNEEGMVGYQHETAKVLRNLLSEFNQVEFIPLLSELFSKMLVISAENNFETITPKIKPKSGKPFFSLEHKLAYKNHEQVCLDWRKQGRPKNNDHPAKKLKLESQRNLQRIAREAEKEKALQNHDDLMNTFNQNVTQVYKKLKKIRGENVKNRKVDQIETLNGTYYGDNVLEGFCSNTEILCKDDSEDIDHAFYKMCQLDNMIIFEISQSENVKIPHMNIENLRNILFKKLKLNKACDVYKLTVEHLRYAGEESLSLVLSLLNMIIDNINCLSSTQLNTAVASIIHKGKDKPIYHHKSYRQVRVSP